MDELGFHRTLHRPGTLLDVGAHDGAFTLPFAALPDSRVLAFEPLPAAFARLRAAAGAAPNVSLRQEALGDRTGEAVLALPVLDGVPNEQWASTAKTYAQHGVAEQRVTVPLRRLDEFALADLTGVKLDAEGAEYEVLRGGRETLLRCRPILSIEIEERHRPGSTWAVPAYLDALGYDGFWEHWGKWRPMASFDRATMQVASPDPRVFAASEPYVFVFYFLPREAAPAMLDRLRKAEAGG
ncbi:FkbM family methyltransferase [Siccirubricoccus sp. KC 17139]|uniref:FkbM family methyltransferase n=1 Tax=Siccirubricoccus soli TaxID=2899147 RepID=A0ABT1DAH4_9PROT|nr:FkbM family methyltransferase [Siccirubricoccus soli]MCO6418240.1 FkbM family methyltransferase [Siccirubricoccus soli]MCP2684375.1 FkbM family methyltransferase [Siccirubricoccus soli]